MTLFTDHFTYEGFLVGSVNKPGVDLGILADEGLVGLSSPARTTTLSDRQGHGREPGSQWANERHISAVLWTTDLATVMAFDAAMTPRPDPDDHVEWVGNFLGVGDQVIYVRPERCDWKVTQLGTQGLFWRIDAEWIAADPTILSLALSDLSFGGDSPVTSVDLPVVNAGLSTSRSPRVWTARMTAHGDVTDVYIRHLDHPGESIRFTGLTMSSGDVLTVDTQRTCRVGTLRVNGLIRSEGSKFPTWPTLSPTIDGDDDTINHIRIGAITGTISGNFHHRSTWSV